MGWTSHGESAYLACFSLTNIFSFGKLRLRGTLRVSRDRTSWQELECFLFALGDFPVGFETKAWGGARVRVARLTPGGVHTSLMLDEEVFAVKVVDEEGWAWWSVAGGWA